LEFDDLLDYAVPRCGPDKYYDALISECSSCEDICHSDPDYLLYCQRNCPDFYQKIISVDASVPRILPFTSTASESLLIDSASQSGHYSATATGFSFSNPLVLITLITVIVSLFVIVTVTVAVAMLCFRRRRQNRREGNDRPAVEEKKSSKLIEELSSISGSHRESIITADRHDSISSAGRHASISSVGRKASVVDSESGGFIPRTRKASIVDSESGQLFDIFSPLDENSDSEQQLIDDQCSCDNCKPD
jgi:hypothetical protein